MPRSPLAAATVAVGTVVVVVVGGVLAATDTFPARGGDVTITTFVHSSVQLEHAGTVIQIDPWSVADLSRAKAADLILVTDDPAHHLDVKAIARLRKPGATVAGPDSTRKQVADAVVLKNGDRRTFGTVQVEATAAYDLSPGEPYHPKGEANGYIVTLGGVRIYLVGVTECVPEIRAQRNIDIAFFPLNLPLQRMEPAAAIDCLRALQPKVVYPYHFDQDWVTRLAGGETPGAGTTRGLAELRGALGGRGMDVRVADWYTLPAPR